MTRLIGILFRYFLFAFLVPARASSPIHPLATTAIKNRDLVASKMTPAQIEKAQELASEWKPR